MRLDPGLIQLLIIAEATAFVVLVALALTVTAVGSRNTRRRSALREAWLGRVLSRIGEAETSGDPGANPDPSAVLGNDEWTVTARSRLASQIGGQSANRLLTGSAEVHARATAEGWCRSRRWWRRVRGVRALILLEADRPDLTHMLYDPRPEVRTEAAAWVATHPSPRGINHLLAMLADEHGRCRWAAADALLRLGGAGVDQLRAHLDTDPPRLAEALRLASRLATPALLAPALRECANPRAGVRAAAAEAVAAVGGEQAFAALGALLTDNDGTVRAAAARGLGDLECWTMAGALADLLYDPVWNVRRAAATSLRALGPVGRLHLRRALTDPDPRASEIAHHVFDLPEVALAVGR